MKRTSGVCTAKCYRWRSEQYSTVGIGCARPQHEWWNVTFASRICSCCESDSHSIYALGNVNIFEHSTTLFLSLVPLFSITLNTYIKNKRLSQNVVAEPIGQLIQGGRPKMLHTYPKHDNLLQVYQLILINR